MIEDDRKKGGLYGLPNITTMILLYLVIITCFFLMLVPNGKRPTFLALIVLFFNNINSLICLWEICLHRNESKVKRDFLTLHERYKGKEILAVFGLFSAPVSLENVVSGRFWCRVWSVWSLYDASYQNSDSFGFLIDCANGYSTLLPTLYFNYAIVAGSSSPVTTPLAVGFLGAAMFWQEMYGTMIYFYSYFGNRRYVGFGKIEVAVLVIGMNSLWIICPAIGMYLSWKVLDEKNFDAFIISVI